MTVQVNYQAGLLHDKLLYSREVLCQKAEDIQA